MRCTPCAGDLTSGDMSGIAPLALIVVLALRRHQGKLQEQVDMVGALMSMQRNTFHKGADVAALNKS